MIVVDASALFPVLTRGGGGAEIAARFFERAEPICAPFLIDAEISSVLRKHVLTGRMSQARAEGALEDFLGFRLLRFPHKQLLRRVFALRDTLTAYDALYVALADSLGAVLITCDRRLARAAQEIVAVEAF